MRVQIETDDRSVDLEEQSGWYPQGEKEVLRDLIEKAVSAVGYTVEELFEDKEA